MLLEAGAGTGKTHRLVETVVAEVLGGTPIDQLLIITFTEKAAAELRDRIRQRLGDRAALGDFDAELARQAVDRLHHAPISTLHGYAQRVLSRYREAAGLGAEIERLDDFRAEQRFAEQWHQTMAAIDADPVLTEALARTLAVGTPLSSWRAVASELDGQWDRAAAWIAQTQTAGGAAPVDSASIARLPPVDASSVVASFREAEALAANVPDSDRLAAFIRSDIEMIRAQIELAAGDDSATLFALAGALCKAANLGRADVWRVYKADIVRARACVGAAWPTLASEVHIAVTPLLAHLAERAVAAAEERRRAGVATYHDLLVWARDLLVNDPVTRLRERARYRRVLIDEFQDTDPLQADIAAALAFAGDTGLTPGEDVPSPLPDSPSMLELESNRLWVVGDPKQSIYRFRRADLSTYRRLQSRLAAEAGEVLDINRRSRPVLIDAVNAVFSVVFPDSDRQLLHGSAQVLHQPLRAFRSDPPKRKVRGVPLLPVVGPGFATFGPHWPDDWRAVAGGPETAKEGEARQIATLLAEGVGRWTVTDPDGRVRPCAASDICVLIRSRGALMHLTGALADVGLAHRIESRGFTWESQEIADVLVVLRAIVHAADPAAILAALRSRVIGCTDTELLSWRLASGAWMLPDLTEPTDGAAAGPADGLAGPVNDGLVWLASLAARRWRLGLAELVEAVISERRLDLLALDAARPRDALARLGVLLDGADRFTASHPTATLAEFVTWCEFQRDRQVLSAETIAAEPDDDAVRIMTIHAAKGLEFPIVLVAGLGHRTRAQPLSVRWSADDAGFVEPVTKLSVRVNDQTQDLEDGPTSAGRSSDALLRARTFKDLRADDLDEDRLEAQRLAYVAFTRARDHLLLSLWTSERRSLLNDLVPAIPSGTPHELPQALSSRPSVKNAGDQGDRERAIAATSDRVATQRAAWAVERAGWASESPAMVSRRPSELVEFKVTAPKPDEPSEATQSVATLRARADSTRARRLGTAVHAVLAALDSAPNREPLADDSLDEMIDAIAVANGVSDAGPEIAAHVATMRAHDTSQRAQRTTGRRFSELAVMGTVGNMVSVGSIDVAWEEGDRLVLSDYKTEYGDRHHLEEHYRPQLMAYRALLATATGREVEIAGVIHLGPVSVGDDKLPPDSPPVK